MSIYYDETPRHKDERRRRKEEIFWIPPRPGKDQDFAAWARSVIVALKREIDGYLFLYAPSPDEAPVALGVLRPDRIDWIASPRAFADFVINVVHFGIVEPTENEDGRIYKAAIPSLRLLESVFSSPALRVTLPEVRQVVRAPAACLLPAGDLQFICRRGIDPVLGIIYAGEEIEPLANEDLIEGLLDRIPFETPADRAAFAAFMLSLLLRSLHGIIDTQPILRPILALSSDRRATGKTSATLALSHVFYGREARMVPPRGKEFVKATGALLKSHEHLALLDNISGQRYSNETLARLATSAEPAVRELGYSRLLSGELAFVLTLNEALLSEDLATRSLFVNLSFSKRRPDLSWVVDFATEHRYELIAALMARLEHTLRHPINNPQDFVKGLKSWRFQWFGRHLFAPMLKLYGATYNTSARTESSGEVLDLLAFALMKQGAESEEAAATSAQVLEVILNPAAFTGKENTALNLPRDEGAREFRTRLSRCISRRAAQTLVGRALAHAVSIGEFHNPIAKETWVFHKTKDATAGGQNNKYWLEARTHDTDIDN